MFKPFTKQILARPAPPPSYEEGSPSKALVPTGAPVGGVLE